MNITNIINRVEEVQGKIYGINNVTIDELTDVVDNIDGDLEDVLDELSDVQDELSEIENALGKLNW